MDIISGIKHRMNLLETTHINISGEISKIEWDTDGLDQTINIELELLKKETESLLHECEEIRSAVFKLGALLREKATKQELQDFESKAHEWPVHEFITKQELHSTFNQYAKR